MSPLILTGAYLFCVGLCVGSFLNVVVYRMPRDLSLVRPPSSCPSCQTRIRFYDNIPVLSWLVLRGKCRTCKAPISPRYLVIELATGVLFLGLFLLYFYWNVRRFGFSGGAVSSFLNGGWLIYVVHITLLAAFLAASAIDMEHWVIPLSVCWFVTVVGVAGASVSGYVMDASVIRGYWIFPLASAKTAAAAAGGAVGMAISLVLLAKKVIRRSYDCENEEDEANLNHRFEALKEVVFLLPLIAGVLVALVLYSWVEMSENAWVDFSQIPFVSGLLGSFWGYLVGCTVVWITRILGTLVFGREAMGLGDVHLMGAAGAVLGPWVVLVAFFVAPFFGLAWAFLKVFSRKSREIPYGPFLSMGVFTVMIFHDWFRNYLNVFLF